MRYLNYSYGDRNVNVQRLGNDNTIILSDFQVGPAEPKTYQIDLPGSDGLLDLSTALTDGDVVYNNRTVTIIFTVTADTSRDDVLAAIDTITGALHGQTIHFNNSGESKWFHGRASVSAENHNTYAIVTVTVDCEPYKTADTTRGDYLEPASSSVTYNCLITNAGNAPTIIELDVPSGVTVTVTRIQQFGSKAYTDTTTREYGEGTWQLGDRLFYPGNVRFYYKANGRFRYDYRERDL